VANLINSLIDQVCDLTAHDGRDFATLTPKDVSSPLLTLLAIAAHIKLEMLIDKQA